MKRVFLYVRVSTEEQAIHGLSIEAQTAALQEWAKVNQCKVVGVYTDAGISARKPASKRPELQRLLADAQAGKGDLIVFTKLDRWFRNIAEYYKVQEVLERCHVDWRTIHEDYDTSTAAGRLKINIMLSVAQDEADRTSERIKAVFEMKRQKLEPLTGTCPTGYKLEGKKMVKDPETREAVEKFFEKYLSSGSITVAQAYVLDNYGLRISYRLASRILDSPAYCGEFYGADGMTPPYITKDEHDKILSMRRHIVRKTQRNRVYLFSGIVFCGECGARLGARLQSGCVTPSYNCPGHYTNRSGCENRVNINEKVIESYLMDNIDEALNRCKAEADQIAQEVKRKNVKGQIASVKKKLAKLKELYINDLITMDEYKADHSTLMAKLDELAAQDAPTETKNLVALEEILHTSWRDNYEEADREGKRAFWRQTIKEIRAYPDRSISFNLNV